MFHTESASKDMEHSGSFSADMKTAPHLDTNGGFLFNLSYLSKKYHVPVCTEIHFLSLLFPVMDLEAIYQDTIVFKKPRPLNSEQDCVVYRYGSFTTGITVVGELFS